MLLVDDEEMIRSMARNMLQKAGYRVTTCNDGHEALETHQQMSEQIDLVILGIGNQDVEIWTPIRLPRNLSRAFIGRRLWPLGKARWLG